MSARTSAYCSGHGSWLPRDQFYRASLKAGESRCKACNREARRERRLRDPLQRLQWSMYQMEHKRGGRYPALGAVRSIVERFGGASAMDGSATTAGDMRVVRYFPELALDTCPWNGVLVTAQQARHMPHNRERRQKQFPAALQEEMAQRRHCYDDDGDADHNNEHTMSPSKG